MAQDLHTLLNAARDDAPPPRLSVDDITSRGRQLVKRRRRLTLVSSVAGGAVSAIAAVTAALVLAAPTALTPALDPSRRPGAVPASPVPTEFVAVPAFTTTYAGYQAGSYVVSDPDLVTTEYQQSSIERSVDVPDSSESYDSSEPAVPMTTSPTAPVGKPGMSRGGILVVFRVGAFNPREFVPNEQLDLRAGSGLLHYSGGQSAEAKPPEDILGYAKSGTDIPVLAWQYAADAWAAIYWSAWETTPSRDEVSAIADGLLPAPPKEFPVGFALKYQPKGYKLLAASFGRELRTSDRTVSAAYMALKSPSRPLFRPIDLADWNPLTFALGTTDPVSRLNGKPSCLADRTSCTLMTDLNGTYLRVDNETAGTAALADPTQLLLTMAAENPDDPSGWPPVTKVFAGP